VRAAEVVDAARASRYDHVESFLDFVDARLAVHTQRLADAETVVERALARPARGWCDGYARVAAAELAVVARLPDAAEHVAAAAPVAEENLWAAACLARAVGRLDGDAGQLAASVAAWEHIGSQFERACTARLVPDAR